MDHDNDDFPPPLPANDQDTSLPPLSSADVALLRAVAARASTLSGSPLRRLIAAYDVEAAARGIGAGLAPVYQGYILRMAEGARVDELVGGEGDGGREGKKRAEKL